MRVLSEEYIIQKFYEYAKNASYQKAGNQYIGGCPSCHEGNSWGKKKRLYYYPEIEILKCYNCNKTWKPIKWISEVSGLSYTEIWKEAENVIPSLKRINIKKQVEQEKIETPDLPDRCVNLFNKSEVEYYINDNKIVKIALDYVKKRRLDTAVNKAKAIYVCLKDDIHTNRLIIPFYNDSNKVVWYQSRELIKERGKNLPKYLSKINSEKSIYGLNSLIPEIGSIFIFEGPIDAMFVKNGVATAGLSLNQKQKTQLDRYSFHEKIWILDNEFKTNQDVHKRAEEIANTEDRLFIWPEKFKNFKDIASITQKCGLDFIRPEFFIENSYQGEKASLKLKQILV